MIPVERKVRWGAVHSASTGSRPVGGGQTQNCCSRVRPYLQQYYSSSHTITVWPYGTQNAACVRAPACHGVICLSPSGLPARRASAGARSWPFVAVRVRMGCHVRWPPEPGAARSADRACAPLGLGGRAFGVARPARRQRSAGCHETEFFIRCPSTCPYVVGMSPMTHRLGRHESDREVEI